MATIHTVSFTPVVNCQVLVTANADLFTRRSVGSSGSVRLFCTQNGSTVDSSAAVFNERTESSFVIRWVFDVMAGALVTVGLDATRPGVGGYSFSNITLTVEQIKR